MTLPFLSQRSCRLAVVIYILVLKSILVELKEGTCNRISAKEKQRGAGFALAHISSDRSGAAGQLRSGPALLAHRQTHSPGHPERKTSGIWGADCLRGE